MVKPSNYYDRLHMKHALSTKAEDNRIADSQHGTLPKKLTGVRRCGRNCKSRGSNQRADAVVHNNFSPAEEELVIKLHATIGSRWSIIAQQIPERSDDDVKNLWNSKLKKKLSAMGIDPITHRPFSQILADYGNIGSNMHKNLAGGTTRFGYLNKQLQDGTINPFIPELEESSSCQVKLCNDSFSSATGPPLNPAYEEDHSVELLSQLQAIKMVTQVSNYSNTTILEASTITRLRNECISSSSSSVSSSSPESPHQAQAQAQAAVTVTVTTNKALGLASSPNFSWRDFLSEDTFLLPAQEDHEKQDIIGIAEEQKHLELEESIKNCFEQGSSSSASFVQDMIERENQIFSETHGILEDPYYY